MKSLFAVVLGLTFCLLATPVNADVIFAIDMDTTQAGIQSSRSAGSGETFTAQVVMQLTGTNRVNAFSLGIDFDNTELNATAVSVTGRPGGFNQVNAATINNSFTPTTGRVRPFDGLNVGGAIEPSTNTVLGTVTFTVLTPNADLNDIFPALQIGGIDDILDADTFAVIPLGVTPGDGGIFFAPGSITVVPEPTTWLFGTVLAGFGIKRLRKRCARV